MGLLLMKKCPKRGKHESCFVQLSRSCKYVAYMKRKWAKTFSENVRLTTNLSKSSKLSGCHLSFSLCIKEQVKDNTGAVLVFYLTSCERLVI